MSFYFSCDATSILNQVLSHDLSEFIFLLQGGWDNVIVEVDSKELVDLWANRNSRSEIETALEDIRENLLMPAGYYASLIAELKTDPRSLCA
ncbi:unnamed protein product [Urochloa humidicola]